MITKSLLAFILAACGVSSTATSATAEPPAEQPDKLPPDEVKPVDQHWCCQSVDYKTKTGDGCDPISGSLETIAACNKVLYCSGDWTKDDGKVHCL
jgi:hypothetical protein